MFDVDDPTTLSHFIVGAALYMFDNKHGTFINCLGVSLNGNPEVCTLSDRFFVELSNYNLLLETSTFRGFGLGTFLLSTLQVLGSLGYKAPTVVPFQPFHLNCHKGGQYQVFTHHLYLQARIEHGSAYASYINIGFSRVLFENDQSLCSNYRKDCPVNSDKKSKIIKKGYHTDDKFMRLLVLKKWLFNVFPAEDV
jgi:hypothetical protein